MRALLILPILLALASCSKHTVDAQADTIAELRLELADSAESADALTDQVVTADTILALRLKRIESLERMVKTLEYHYAQRMDTIDEHAALAERLLETNDRLLAENKRLLDRP